MGKRIALAIALVVGLVAVAAVFSTVWLPRFTEHGPQAAVDLGGAGMRDLGGGSTAQDVRQVVIVDVAGTVEAVRGGEAPTPLKRGDHLAPEDRVRTGADGRAELAAGDDTRIELGAATEVEVGQLTRELSKFKLTDGCVSARVAGGRAPRLRVEVAGSDAVAEARDAEFSMLSTGKGQVTVATQRGAVDLSARGQTVQVNAGELSVVRAESAPSAPVKIPSSLFLKVGGAGAALQRERKTVVRGTTSPGAVVNVGGVRVGADERGEFTATVPLADGTHVLIVHSEDALGRKTERALPPLTVDSKPPEVKTEVKW